MKKKMLTKLVINIYICNRYILYFFFKNYLPLPTYSCNVSIHSTYLRSFHKDIFSMVNHAFSLVRELFSEDFLVENHTGTRKEVLENKVSNWYESISGDFLKQGLFSTGLF